MARFYYETNTFMQSEHSGTHTDAPAHFASGRWRTADIPFERLAGPAAVVDIRRGFYRIFAVNIHRFHQFL